MSTDLTVKPLMRMLHATDATSVCVMLFFGNFPMAISKQEGDILFLIIKNVSLSGIQLFKFEKLEE